MLSRWFNTKSGDTPAQAKPDAKTPAAEPTPAKHAVWLAEITGDQSLEDITDPELLHTLVKHSERLDKRANRIVRDKLSALRDQEKLRQQQHEHETHLCERLERMARLQHHPLFDSELAHLEQQWQACEAPVATLTERVQQALTLCHGIAQTAQQAIEAANAEIEADAARREAEAAQREVDADNLAAAAEAEQAGAAAKAESKAAAKANSAEQQRVKEDASRALASQLDTLETALAIPDGKKAQHLLDRAREQFGKLDSKLAHRHEGRLHLLQGQLRELQDWQVFAALPKLEQLCEAMEKLIHTDLPPAPKATSVRELQDAWRKIKLPPGKHSQALWDRFHKAGETAWIPCAAHFEQEKQQRTFNLQQRITICAALEQFEQGQDWDKADWKAVARILEKARQEFQQFHPIERGEEKSIRKRFDAAFNAIQTHLLTEQKRNEERKQQLVNNAAALEAMTDVEQATERVRQLQTQWKDVGSTRRHEDQKLWQRFQTHCNAVFAKRQSVRDAARQEEQDQAQTARQLCTSIAALAQLDDSALSANAAEFDRLQSSFRELLPRLPEKQQHAIKKSFHTACDQYRDKVAGIGKRQRQQQWLALAQRAALCTELEIDPTTTQQAALLPAWEEARAINLPSEWLKTIQARWDAACAHVESGTTPDYAMNEQQRRTLCIELEILLDLETPAEDKPLRHNLQMQKLQKGLGQTAGPRLERQEAFLLQWYSTAAATPAVQTALEARFTQASAAT